MITLCTCNGENEHCFKCGGTGYLALTPDKDVQPLPPQPVPQQPGATEHHGPVVSYPTGPKLAPPG